MKDKRSNGIHGHFPYKINRLSHLINQRVLKKIFALHMDIPKLCNSRIPSQRGPFFLFLFIALSISVCFFYLYVSSCLSVCISLSSYHIYILAASLQASSGFAAIGVSGPGPIMVFTLCLYDSIN